MTISVGMLRRIQDTDRMGNGVMIPTKENNSSAEAAKMMLIGIIVEREGKAARLKEERLKKPVSNEILQYFEAIELYVGGSCPLLALDRASLSNF